VPEERGSLCPPSANFRNSRKLHRETGSTSAVVPCPADKQALDVGAQLAGSLKDDIPIGSVVLGDYVYNGHSAKVEDTETLGRPHGLPAARELFTAAQALIYSDEWQDLIRPPYGIELPNRAEFPCKLPPIATLKGIVSGEEVVAGGKSPRFVWLRKHFNDCGAVEMEGWGAMSAAHHENTPAIIVRGISDMCAGKDAAKDEMYQPIAASHGAAFAFGILSFRSKVPSTSAPALGTERPATASEIPNSIPEERRVEFVLNFKGVEEEWPANKVDAVVERLRTLVNDERRLKRNLDGRSDCFCSPGHCVTTSSPHHHDTSKRGLQTWHRVRHGSCGRVRDLAGTHQEVHPALTFKGFPAIRDCAAAAIPQLAIRSTPLATRCQCRCAGLAVR
jgi:nucleoside phosphorylase